MAASDASLPGAGRSSGTLPFAMEADDDERASANEEPWYELGMKWSSPAIFAAIMMLGCSSDEGNGQAIPSDGATDASEASVDDVASERSPSKDVSTDAARGDRFIDIFDAFPLPDGPLGGCLTCVRDQCGAQVNECANSESCRAGLLCTLTTCVAAGGDGGPDIACVTSCFMGDFGAVLTVAGSFACINTGCGGACSPPGITEAGVPGDGGFFDVDAGDSMDSGVADVGPGD